MNYVSLRQSMYMMGKEQGNSKNSPNTYSQKGRMGINPLWPLTTTPSIYFRQLTQDCRPASRARGQLPGTDSLPVAPWPYLWRQWEGSLGNVPHCCGFFLEARSSRLLGAVLCSTPLKACWSWSAPCVLPIPWLGTVTWVLPGGVPEAGLFCLWAATPRLLPILHAYIILANFIRPSLLATLKILTSREKMCSLNPNFSSDFYNEYECPFFKKAENPKLWGMGRYIWREDWSWHKCPIYINFTLWWLLLF